MDPAVLSLIAPTAAGAKLLHQLLGPTADYLGEGLRDWAATRIENVDRIAKRAAEKLGPSELAKRGGVPPRVLKSVLDEGSFIEDDVAVEYMAGMLAASRTEDGVDDRAVSLVSLIGRLSTYQIRAHYVMYAAAQKVVAGRSLEEVDLGREDDLKEFGRFLMPLGDFYSGLGVELDESSAPLLMHCIAGLRREELLEPGYGTGTPEVLQKATGRQIEIDGIIYTISLHGLELYCAAHGMRGLPKRDFLGSSDGFQVESDIRISDDTILLSSVPKLEAA